MMFRQHPLFHRRQVRDRPGNGSFTGKPGRFLGTKLRFLRVLELGIQGTAVCNRRIRCVELGPRRLQTTVPWGMAQATHTLNRAAAVTTIAHADPTR